MTAPIRKRKDRIPLRVERGRLVPFDDMAASMLRAKGYGLGDVVMADLAKSRNPKFHGLAHQLGSLLAENLDAFEGVNSHAVLKRLQIEANVGCDEMALMFPGVGPCVYRVPRSLSFGSMDEAEFKQVIAAMCRHISKTYWPTCTPEQVEAMASAWVEAK